MALSEKKIARIKVDYEAGLISINKLCEKYNINRTKLHRLKNKHGWIKGKCNERVTKSVTKKAEKRLVSKESEKLFDFTDDHIRNIETVNKSGQVLLQAFVRELKESRGRLSKADGDKYKALNQALEIAAKTFDLTFKSKRFAMGFSKEEQDKKAVYNIINFADADDTL